MVNYFIYAKDFSSSTYEVNHYHTNGLKSLVQFKSEVQSINEELLKAGEPPTESKVIYLHWGDCCYEVSEDEAVDTYRNQDCGWMGTEPATIIKWMQQNCDLCCEENKIRLLYIITDGVIDDKDAAKCVKLNDNMHYETTVFHALNKDLDQIDISVVVSFLKRRCKIYRNCELLDDCDISKDFDYDAINISNFDCEKDKLKSYIKLKYINKTKNDALALSDIDQLKILRNRLFAELASPSQNTKVKVNLDTKDRDEFLREFVKSNWYRNLNIPVDDCDVAIEQSIQNFIDYILSEKKSHSFDALTFDTKWDNIEEEPIVDINFTEAQKIEFPVIILNDEDQIPVIQLTELNLLDKLIFHDANKSTDHVSLASFSKFNSAMECPLLLWDDPDISESIGYCYTLDTYKQILKHTDKPEPTSLFHGCLVLSDTDEFDKYNDYILSATYFNFKKVNYNVGLFYYVLWKNCKNMEGMDKSFVEQFKKYAMRRISLSRCKVGLSSLHSDPPEITSLPTALWYSLELSSHLFKNHPKNFIHERLRVYHDVAHCMIEILQYFDYDLDLESIERRRDLIRHVMILKEIPTQEEKVYFILKQIFKEVNGFLVCEIEHPSNLSKLNYLNLSHKAILRDDVINRKVHLNDYVHLMYFIDSVNNPKVDIKICDRTFRPYFTVDEHKSFYTKVASVTKEVVIVNDDDKDKIDIAFEALDSLKFDKVLSVYNLYIECVQECRRYPTLSEYIDYILWRKRFTGNLVTIFAPNSYSGAEEAYFLYQKSLANVDASEFIEVCEKYVSRFKRVKVEKIKKFHTDEEINEFIASEELKANLQRNSC